METEEVTSGNENTQPSGQNQTDNEVVPLKVYQKTLTQEKNLRERFKQTQDELEQLKNNQLSMEGKKDELIKSLGDKVKTLENEYKQKTSAFGWSRVESAIKEEALKSGCKDANVLIKLLGDDDLSLISVDDKFNVDQEAVKRVIDSSKQKFSNIDLFGKPAPKINDMIPANNANVNTKDDSLTKEQLIQKIKSQL